MKSISIKNIKKLEDIHVEWPDNTKLIIVRGNNGSGKSTFAQVLNSILSVKNEMREPVTIGKESSSAVYKFTTNNGLPVNVKWEHKDGKDTFKCTIIKDGKSSTVSKVSDLKELFGNHYKYNVYDIFEMTKSVPGKRKFVNEFIYGSLSDLLREELETLSKSIATTSSKENEHNLYFKRRRLKAEADILAAKLSHVEWDEADEKKLGELINSKKLELERQDTILSIIDKNKEFTEVSKTIYDKLQNILSDINYMNDHGIDFNPGIFEQVVIDALKNRKSIRLKSEAETAEALSECEKRIDSYTNEINVLNYKKQQNIEAKQSIDEYTSLKEQIELVDNKMEIAKDRIKEISSMAKLPQGVTYLDDEIRINGYLFDSLSVSDTEARLAVIALLSHLNESKFVDIGDVSVYDKNSYSKLLSIAEQNNCTLVAQYVNDDELNFEIISE